MAFPAQNFEDAVSNTITSSDQLYNVINGLATDTITTDSGEIPSLRKSLIDNFFFLDPIDWLQGENSTKFNQLYKFTDGLLWFAPAATVANPVPLGVSPNGDGNWLISPFSVTTPVAPIQEPRQIGDGVNVTFSTPSTIFVQPSSVIVRLDGIYQSSLDDYTIDASGNVMFTSGIPATGVFVDITLYNPVVTENPSELNILATGSTTPRMLKDRFGDVANVLDFGAKGDGVTDDHLAIQEALNTSKHIIIPDTGADFLVSDTLQVQSNSTLEFQGSYVRLTQSSSIGGVIACLGSTLNDVTTWVENVLIINPLVDGGDNGHPTGANKGENGVSGYKARNIRVVGGVVKNCRYGTDSRTSAGGKAINWEFGVSDIFVTGTVIENCSSALEVVGGIFGAQGHPFGYEQYALNVNYSNITVKNCGRVLRLVRSESPTLTNGLDIIYGTVTGIRAINCGREDTGSILDYGAITADRLTNFTVKDVVLRNESSYGAIDSVIRQHKGYFCSFEVDFQGDCNILINHLIPEGGQPSGVLEDCEYKVNHLSGSANYIINSATGDTSLNDNYYECKTAILNTAITRNSITGFGLFTDGRKRTQITGRINEIFVEGNNYNDATSWKFVNPIELNGFTITDGAGNQKVLDSPDKLRMRAEGVDTLTLKSNAVNISNIQNSTIGLSAGDVWNDAGTLKIV